MKRVDANQAAIVKALRHAGCSVLSLAEHGHGCPDLLVGRAHHNLLLEVKSTDGTLTLEQIDWHFAWRGQVAVVHSPEEALKAVGL